MRIIVNRRRGGDRRRRRYFPEDDRRFSERRHPCSDSYLLVVGNYGIDRCVLTISLLASLLFLSVLVGSLLNFL